MARFQGLRGNSEHKQDTGNGITTKRVLRYAMMPEILPRIRALGMHFGHFAYLIALVFRSARLIPDGHPVLNAANIGQFGVREVIAMAANNITWSKNNIDQIAIFSAIVIGLVLVAIQAVLIAVAALVGFNPANAQSYFETENPEQDLVTQTMAVIFGPDLGIFTPVNSTDFGITANYAPIHETIYQILSIYSLATMVVAVIIVIYYVMTVVGEAAKTGTPFGQRFNSLWAPIRLVVALGLLVPLGSGLNSAQYITLWLAKMGSGLGNQAWYVFFDNVANRDPSTYVVSNPSAFRLDSVVERVVLAEVCKEGFNKVGDGVYTRELETSADGYFMLKWPGSDSVPSFRESCGELNLNELSSTTRRGQGHGRDVRSAIARNEIVPIDQINALVEDIVLNDIVPKAEELAKEYVAYTIPVNGRTVADDPSFDIKSEVRALSDTVSEKYTRGIEAIYASDALSNLQDKIANDREKGWVYAGVWYMQIGRIVQQIEAPKTSAIPQMRLPEFISKEYNEPGWFTRNFSIEYAREYSEDVDGLVNTALSKIIADLRKREVDGDARRLSRTGRGGDPDSVEDTAYQACVGLDSDSTFGLRLKCAIGSMLVPDELFAIKAGTSVDPMTSLIKAGGQIFERAFYFVLVGIGSDVAGSLIAGKMPIVSGLLDGLGNVLVLIGMVGLGAGIALYFIVPLLPFIFFFFAIIGWIMEIIEAIIAMPLWALAHLRIDGDGMPGGAALQGYVLLLGILLRPALIIISLIFGYLVFIFGTYLLSMLFDPVLNVIEGENMNGLQMLMFALIFAFLIYNLAMVSFKMVDTVPAQAMRWLGAGGQAFQDGRDAMGGMSGALVGGAVVGTQLAGGISSTAKTTGQGMRKNSFGGALLSDEEKAQARNAKIDADIKEDDARKRGLIS